MEKYIERCFIEAGLLTEDGSRVLGPEACFDPYIYDFSKIPPCPLCFEEINRANQHPMGRLLKMHKIFHLGIPCLWVGYFHQKIIARHQGIQIKRYTKDDLKKSLDLWFVQVLLSVLVALISPHRCSRLYNRRGLQSSRSCALPL